MPGNNVACGTLMRSARINSYVFHGGYEPGVSSDTGLELGKRLSFQYALMPHAGDWRAAGSWRAGLEFNNPLIAKTVDARMRVLCPAMGNAQGVARERMSALTSGCACASMAEL